jgi:hypothetical protein
MLSLSLRMVLKMKPEISLNYGHGATGYGTVSSWACGVAQEIGFFFIGGSRGGIISGGKRVDFKHVL